MASAEQWNDSDFAAEVTAARIQGPRGVAILLLFGVVLFFVAAITWAWWAEIDEVTRGQGTVIPSSQVQVIQNLEGGILKEILVREGEMVEAGQILLRIDDTGFAASLGEQQAAYYSLMGQMARLTAESEGGALEFPPELMAEARQLAVNERKLFNARRADLKSQLGILRQQVDQRRQELTELRGQLKQNRSSLVLLEEELQMTEPLVRNGVVPKINLLRLRREVNDLEGVIQSTILALPRAKSAVQEATRRIEERYLNSRSEALRELNAIKAEFAQVEQSILAARDRVVRTDLRSPVRGIVKQLNISTIGGVVMPGMNLMEVVPLDDTLLVEARILPADVAFLKPGQEATVKLTAYDFAIYGGLPATLERISADTILDERGDSYYQIIVRTDKSELVHQGKVLPIIPGMVASVDILTGRKTVLDYLLKPILKARDRALTER
ncbi:MAG: HlyD family type I secretion periplasmic adaptor subunit [Proteobacteria bacterium]|nr:HlyD family type I secretion periplasmic adaptor subunit [Pseudomonadota bacterium]